MKLSQNPRRRLRQLQKHAPPGTIYMQMRWRSFKEPLMRAKSRAWREALAPLESPAEDER